MDNVSNIESVFSKYDDLVTEFGRKKLEERYEVLLHSATEFIKKMDYGSIVRVDEYTLLYAMLDYFSDILRLKQFHNINKVTEIKIISYEAFWLLKRKPLQLLTREEGAVYVNEQFILSRIIHCLMDNDERAVDVFANDKLEFFNESLFYFLKYRWFDSQTIEMFILSFIAGKTYFEELNR